VDDAFGRIRGDEDVADMNGRVLLDVSRDARGPVERC
jgi:hypothetical protein